MEIKTEITVDLDDLLKDEEKSGKIYGFIKKIYEKIKEPRKCYSNLYSDREIEALAKSNIKTTVLNRW